MSLISEWFRSLIDRIRAMTLVWSKKYPPLKIINHADRSSLTDTNNEIVSLMFIDVTGFSCVVEDLTPIDTYQAIRPVMEMAISEVQKHGGIIDKTMGDGLFAYFRDKNGKFKTVSHADRALDCGIQIQKNLMTMTIDQDSDDSVMPMRIGINTASVCIGKLSGSNYQEYGIFGRGVNFAQRLEQACDDYSVMASEATIELSTKYSAATNGLSRKIIKPKHYHEVMTVFEIDPFLDNQLLREKAIEKYRVSRKLQRRQERIHVPQEINFEFQSDFGDVRLVDFSTGGFSVSLEKYLAKNVDFSIPVDSLSSAIAKELINRGIERLWLKVKWGKIENENYVHGAQFLNLSDNQRELIFHCLEDHFFSEEQQQYAS